MIVQWAPWAYVGTLVAVLVCLYVGHYRGKINLWDCVTVTKDGRVFTDGTKLYLAGAFVVMTTGFAYLVLLDKMNEMFALIYVGTFAGAKWACDREQRLNKPSDKQPDADATLAKAGMGFTTK